MMDIVGPRSAASIYLVTVGTCIKDLSMGVARIRGLFEYCVINTLSLHSKLHETCVVITCYQNS